MGIKRERQGHRRSPLILAGGGAPTWRNDDAPGDARVTRLAERQADRDHRERVLLDEGIAASIGTLHETMGRDLDVQVMVVATFGDPLAGDPDDPERWRAVPIHTCFASLHAERPPTDTHRRYLAMEGLRAVSPALRDGLEVAVGVLDALEELQRRADAGDADAQARCGLILDALQRVAAPDRHEEVQR
jgi:hypothetical protein